MEKRTTVLMIPGFGEYPETKTFVDLKKILIERRLNVEILSWPNYPENLKEYSITNTLKHAREVITSLLSKGETVYLHGHSMGGILAVILASEFPVNRISLTITPFQAGTDDDLAGKYKEWKETGVREFTSSKYGKLLIPFCFIEDARQYNALEYIKKVNIPKLFIAGEDDNTVPWKTAYKLYESANEPKVWHLIKGMEHKFQYQEDKLLEVNKILVEFLLG